MKKLLVGLMMSLALWGVAHASYVGILTWADGMVEVTPTSPWESFLTRFSWEVTDLGGGRWSYRYSLVTPHDTGFGGVPVSEAPVNRFFIQTDESVTDVNVVSMSLGGIIDRHFLGFDRLYGVLFDGLNCLVCDVEMTLDVVPMWGSFAGLGYSDDFGNLTAYNTFVGNTSTVSIGGQAEGLILVPGTRQVTGGTIPEPATLFLVALAIILLAGFASRQSREL